MANIKVNSYYQRTIRFLDIGSYKSIIKYNQRFICFDCNKTFNETSSLVEKGSTISNQTKILLLSKARKKTSFTDIAKSLDISTTTAIKEFKDHISNYECRLTEVLCIDEFKASTIAEICINYWGRCGKMISYLQENKNIFIITFNLYQKKKE